MVRLRQQADGFSHAPVLRGPDDHHPAPFVATIEDTSTVVAGSSTYNLDIALPHSNFQLATAMIMGPRRLFGAGSNFRESAYITATRNIAEAMGFTVRDSGLQFRAYMHNYSKMAGNSYLSHKIFDNDTVLNNRYIGVVDSLITGSIFRIIFRNWSAVARTLWVKGKATAG